MEEHRLVLGGGKVQRTLMMTEYMILGWLRGFLAVRWHLYLKNILNVVYVILYYLGPNLIIVPVVVILI
jgi:hypothetical protein